MHFAPMPTKQFIGNSLTKDDHVTHFQAFGGKYISSKTFYVQTNKRGLNKKRSLISQALFWGHVCVPSGFKQHSSISLLNNAVIIIFPLQAEERNSLVRDISAAMEKAWDSFEKSNKNIQTIADDQAKIEQTIRSLVEEITAMVCTNCFWY